MTSRKRSFRNCSQKQAGRSPRPIWCRSKPRVHKLREAGNTDVPTGIAAPQAQGAQAAPDGRDMQSPETYIGYGRGENFASGPARQDRPFPYQLPFPLRQNQWGLSGIWNIGSEKAVLHRTPGAIAFNFHARDLHLVLGPAENGEAVRYRVTIDGQAPGDVFDVRVQTAVFMHHQHHRQTAAGLRRLGQ